MRQGGDIMTLVRGTMFLLPGKKTNNQSIDRGKVGSGIWPGYRYALDNYITWLTMD